MRKIGKIVLWSFAIIIGIGIIAAIANPTPSPTQVKADSKETPKETPKPDEAEITAEEFKQIQNGLTLDQVEKIIGGKGELQSTAGDGQYKSELYMWKGNTFGGNANITLQGGKVMAKAQFGLE